MNQQLVLESSLGFYAGHAACKISVRIFMILEWSVYTQLDA